MPHASRVHGRQSKGYLQLLLVRGAICEQLERRQASQQRSVEVVREDVVDHGVRKRITVKHRLAYPPLDVGLENTAWPACRPASSDICRAPRPAQ